MIKDLISEKREIRIKRQKRGREKEGKKKKRILNAYL